MWLVACASNLAWPNPDGNGLVTVEEMSMIRNRFESGVDQLSTQHNARIAIELALAARGGVDKRIAALTPPETQARLIESNTMIVKVSFSRSIGYGANYLQQFHVIDRNWRGEWKHRTYSESVVLEMRK
jgi:hypothetical protein